MWKKLALVLFLAAPGISNATIGSITNQVNAVTVIQRDKLNLAGSKGTGVEMNDTIKTTLGKADITFVDETKVQVNENSRLVIDDFVYDPKTPKGSKLALKFASGTVRYASGAIAHNNPSSVAINTPSATIGVRGTDFSAVVDDTGASMVVLLPSCPEGFKSVEDDCVTGIIDVSNDSGTVVLDKPFQATYVASRQITPAKPVVLRLTADQINNMLIVSPPTGLNTTQSKDTKKDSNDPTDLGYNFLKQNFLKNELDEPIVLEPPPTPSNTAVLPDWTANSEVVKVITNTQVSLCRTDSSSNAQCIVVPKDQNSVVTQSEGQITIKNRVNSGNGTTIILKQN